LFAVGIIYADHGVFLDIFPRVFCARKALQVALPNCLIDDSLSVRDAERLTGFAAADFSRIGEALLKGFTIDRLMTVLDRLNRDLRVSVSVMPRNLAASSHSTL